MKILLVSGHRPGHNPCKATGVNEGELNTELVRTLLPLLSPYADVEVYPYERDMYLDNKNGCLKVSLKDYRYIFEVHFNAGGGRGTSVQLHSSYRGGISVEQAIVNNVAARAIAKGIIDGFGLKTGDTGSPSGQNQSRDVLVTGCSSLNVRRTPNGAILGTVKGGTALAVIGTGTDPDGDIWYRISAGSLTGYVWPKYVR